MVKIISLVENTSTCGCTTAHGLSLYIETPSHKLLFDVGGDETIIKNAELLGVDLSSVDTVIISHGHRDHAGALSLFMGCNPTAQIYIQRQSFAPHFSHRPAGVADIGLDVSLMANERVTLLDGEYRIDDELMLFKVTDNSQCPSSANSSLFEGDAPDEFCHEQNLLISGERPIIVVGCGHNGIVNIMNRAEEFTPQICIGGFHLTNPSARRDEPRELIDTIIERLRRYRGVEFYTCHCTGVAVYDYMKTKMDNINYISCGQQIDTKI